MKKKPKTLIRIVVVLADIQTLELSNTKQEWAPRNGDYEE
jgi:hypothetical protein